MNGDRRAVLAERAKDGNPYALHDFKADLASMPVEEAFAVYCDFLGKEPRPQLRRTQASSMLAVGRTRAAFYLETAPSGEIFHTPAPRVIGEGNQRDLVARTRTGYVACFNNARVWGKSASIEFEDQVLFDFEDWELAGYDDRLDLDPRIFRADGADLWHIRDAEEKADISVERAFMLTGSHTRAFGHWIWEYLTKYVAALMTGILPPHSVLIDADMPETHREALEMLLPAGCDIVVVGVHQSAGAKELWCASNLFLMPLYPIVNERYDLNLFCSPPHRFLPIIAWMTEFYAPEPDSGDHADRVFLARRPNRHRRLENSPEIEALLREKGFKIVYPEDLPFAEQVRLLCRARYVVGPDGSAFFLAFFCRPGARLALFCHPDVEDFSEFTGIVEKAGIDVTVLTGPFTQMHPSWRHLSNYRIHMSDLENFLQEWLV